MEESEFRGIIHQEWTRGHRGTGRHGGFAIADYNGGREVRQKNEQIYSPPRNHYGGKRMRTHQVVDALEVHYKEPLIGTKQKKTSSYCYTHTNKGAIKCKAIKVPDAAQHSTDRCTIGHRLTNQRTHSNFVPHRNGYSTRIKRQRSSPSAFMPKPSTKQYHGYYSDRRSHTSNRIRNK